MSGDVGEIDLSGTTTLEQWRKSRAKEAENPVHVVRPSEKTGGIGGPGD